MIKCILCGCESGSLLCGNCNTTDIRQLCLRLAVYDPASQSEPLWDELSADLINPSNFKNVVFALTTDLPSPEKEFLRLKCLMGKFSVVRKESRQWLYDNADTLLEGALSESETILVQGVLMDAYSKDYRYSEAEATAEKLCLKDNLDTGTAMLLGDYLIKTRRYEQGEDVLKQCVGKADSAQREQIEKMLEEASLRQLGKENGGWSEYIPANRENKQKYVDFMCSIGIDVEMPVYKEKPPKPMSIGDYPDFYEERNAGFRSFVAYDIETTGLNPKFDSIIEIGAVRVHDGEITESFRHFAKPFKQGITSEVEKLTGITPDMVKEADEMWTVFNEFADFIGEDILVGFNNRLFDNLFLKRAGRYANRILSNKSFDVMDYGDKFKEQLRSDGKHFSLEKLSGLLGIENPQTHRALADAETTARVYLKLLDLDTGNTNTSATLDDMLDDEWD